MVMLSRHYSSFLLGTGSAKVQPFEIQTLFHIYYTTLAVQKFGGYDLHGNEVTENAMPVYYVANVFILKLDKLDSLKFSCSANRRCSLIHIRNEPRASYLMTWQFNDLEAQESAAAFTRSTTSHVICQSGPSDTI